MASEYPLIGQAVFREALEEKVKEGLTPKQAIESATLEAAGSDLSKASVDAVAKDRLRNSLLREGLGLDDPETKEAFGKMLVDRASQVDCGSFPEWLTEGITDPEKRNKLRLDYAKMINNHVAAALITTKSEQTVKSEVSDRPEYELEFRDTRGRWPRPDEVTFYLNSDPHHWPDETVVGTGSA